MVHSGSDHASTGPEEARRRAAASRERIMSIHHLTRRIVSRRRVKPHDGSSIT
jgi:hypothetical protein